MSLRSIIWNIAAVIVVAGFTHRVIYPAVKEIRYMNRYLKKALEHGELYVRFDSMSRAVRVAYRVGLIRVAVRPLADTEEATVLLEKSIGKKIYMRRGRVVASGWLRVVARDPEKKEPAYIVVESRGDEVGPLKGPFPEAAFADWPFILIFKDQQQEKK